MALVRFWVKEHFLHVFFTSMDIKSSLVTKHLVIYGIYGKSKPATNPKTETTESIYTSEKVPLITG